MEDREEVIEGVGDPAKERTLAEPPDELEDEHPDELSNEEPEDEGEGSGESDGVPR